MQPNRRHGCYSSRLDIYRSRWPQFRQALSLKDEASKADLVLTIDEIKKHILDRVEFSAIAVARKICSPRRSRFSARERYELQTGLNSERSGKREAAITPLIDQAIADGKMTPAQQRSP